MKFFAILLQIRIRMRSLFKWTWAIDKGWVTFGDTNNS